MTRAGAYIRLMVGILLGLGGPANGAGAGVTLSRTIELPGVRGARTNVGVPGRIDHFAYDLATKRLFVAALENNSLEVVDLETGKRIKSITGLSHPQGIAIAANTGCAAVACGGDGRVHLFDTRSLEERRIIDVGPDADNVRYDSGAETILVTYGDTNKGAIAIFDSRSWNKRREVLFPSRPESFQLDPAGSRLFANLPRGVRAVEPGQVAVADRAEGKVSTLIPLIDRARNFPMAFDPKHERLFIATRRPAKLVVLDTRRCAVVAEAWCTDDSDDLAYDAERNRVFVIGGGFRPDLQKTSEASPCSLPGEMGALDVFDIKADGTPVRLSGTPTAVHARTGLFVPSRRAIYVAVPCRERRDAQILEFLVD